MSNGYCLDWASAATLQAYGHHYHLAVSGSKVSFRVKVLYRTVIMIFISRDFQAPIESRVFS